MTDNAECVQRLQRWLYAWQFRPENCAVVHSPSLGHLAGLGSSLMESVRLMMRAVESGAVYRPAGEWLWAGGPNASACQLGCSSIDCFTLPLSVCNTSRATREAFTDEAFDYALANNTTPVSVCGLARQFRKPTLWVIGNLILYHLRFPPTSYDAIHSRVLTALHGRPEAHPSDQYSAVLFHRGESRGPGTPARKNLSIPSHIRTPTSFSAGVHARTAEMDDGRHALDLTEYLAVVDQKSKASVRAGGPPVVHVYVSSNAPELNVGSLGRLYRRFPRNYTFEVLPHLSFGNADPETVLTSAVKQRGHRRELPPLRNLFLEYAADLEALTRADLFVGTHSNVYALAAALRLTLFPERPLEHTCHLDSHYYPARLVC
eukprot:EG_transcript_16100